MTTFYLYRAKSGRVLATLSLSSALKNSSNLHLVRAIVPDSVNLCALFSLCCEYTCLRLASDAVNLIFGRHSTSLVITEWSVASKLFTSSSVSVLTLTDSSQLLSSDSVMWRMPFPTSLTDLVIRMDFMEETTERMSDMILSSPWY